MNQPQLVAAILLTITGHERDTALSAAVNLILCVALRSKWGRKGVARRRLDNQQVRDLLIVQQCSASGHGSTLQRRFSDKKEPTRAVLVFETPTRPVCTASHFPVPRVRPYDRLPPIGWLRRSDFGFVTVRLHGP